MRRALTALAGLCMAAAPGLAEAPEGAREAFADGRFLEAADLGEAAATPDSLALAAEALAIHGYYLAKDGDKQALFTRAIGLAEAALAGDAGNAQAHLQHAHTMGRYAQTIGDFEAFNAGYAERTRAAIDNALAIEPDMVPALLSLAAWHAEIVAAAGGFMADLLYSATEEDALALYGRAHALAPDNAGVDLEYAIGLLLLDDDDNCVQARDLLRRAATLPIDNGYEEIVRDQAEIRLAVLECDE